MTDQPAKPIPPSSLDPFLAVFLRRVGELPDGYAPMADGRAFAAALDWSPSFVEAVFTSARARGLLEPFRAKGRRARSRWGVSRRGRDWAATRVAADEPVVADKPTAPLPLDLSRRRRS